MTRGAGFTLLEVMIATSIAAIGIVSLLELFGGSVRLARASTEQTHALIVAQSIMDGALWRAELAEGDLDGTIGDYRWTMTIDAVDPLLGATEEAPLEDASDAYELYEIVVTMEWGSPLPKSLELRTLRIMEKF